MGHSGTTPSQHEFRLYNLIHAKIPSKYWEAFVVLYLLKHCSIFVSIAPYLFTGQSIFLALMGIDYYSLFKNNLGSGIGFAFVHSGHV